MIWEKIAKRKREVKRDPTNQAAFFLGDFNLLDEGEASLHAEAPDVGKLQWPEELNTPAVTNRWRASMADLVGPHQANFTHFAAGANVFNRIDRISTALPAWAFVRVRAHATAVSCPQRLARKGISDHAPVLLSLAPRCAISAASRPLPQQVVKFRTYKEHHDALAKAYLDPNMPTVQRWERRT